LESACVVSKFECVVTYFVCEIAYQDWQNGKNTVCTI